MRSMGETAMGSYFQYKFENLRKEVVDRTPIAGLAAVSASEDKKVNNIIEEIIPKEVIEKVKSRL
jgi:hypothetical protein